MIIQSFLTLCLSVFVSTAFAIEGQFHFKGQYAVTGSTRYENVYAPSPKGQARLDELRQDGYSCQPKLQLVQCKKVFPGLAALPEELAHVTSPVNSADFGTIESLKLISQGDVVAIYEAAQTATIDGNTYATVKYIEQTTLTKASVGDPASPESYYSFLIYPESVAVLENITHTESKWAFQVYDVHFFLQ